MASEKPSTKQPIDTSMVALARVDAYEGTLDDFFRRNPYFFAPWIIFASSLYGMQYIPILQAYFDAQGMQCFGAMPALKLAIWGILTQYALHGWIAVNHETLSAKGLKCAKNVSYNFQADETHIRSTLILMVTMMTYALVPMRMTPADTWSDAILQFIIGYAILLVVGDAWFFVVHYTFHTKHLYKIFHKKHHKWKNPTSFAAYYIMSFSQIVQEHFCVIACMLFCPIPVSAFLFYEYYGVVASQIHHCGFELGELEVPFTGGYLHLEKIMSVCGLCLGLILGGQVTSDHEYHHEKFVGNYQLSYTYLDRLFGTYVDTSKKSALNEPLMEA